MCWTQNIKEGESLKDGIHDLDWDCIFGNRVDDSMKELSPEG